MANRVHHLTNYGIKYCPSCGEVKPIGDFVAGYCGQCRQDRAKDALEELKKEVFQHLGGACVVCDERDPEKLTLSQLRPNGFDGTLSYLRAHSYPTDFKLVCKNCLGS